MPVNNLLSAIKVSDAIYLELTDKRHAQSLFNLVNNNRPYLREWLPWVDNMQTVEDFQAYIKRSEKQLEEDTDYGYMIRVNNLMVGRIGVHYIDRQNRCGAIGYWLGEAFAGNGIMTQSCQALIGHCFTVLKLNRIEIKCGTGNYKSAAIPERLNFKKEGILRQAEWLNERFIDLTLYSLLKEEWKG